MLLITPDRRRQGPPETARPPETSDGVVSDVVRVVRVRCRIWLYGIKARRLRRRAVGLSPWRPCPTCAARHIRACRSAPARRAGCGVRVLVDRVWPRGVRKEDAHLDEWLREVAPSAELRRWYGHGPERFAEFRHRYLAELRNPQHREVAQHLRSLAREQDLTLLTATQDVEHSQAAVLAEWLGQHK